MHVDGAVSVAVEHADEEPTGLCVEVAPVVVEEGLPQLDGRDLARFVGIHSLG